MKAAQLLFLVVWPVVGYPQANAFHPDSVFLRISRLQSKGDPFFHDGLFPTLRYRRDGKEVRQDNTIYYTALIAFTLGSAKGALSPEFQLLADSVIARATANYFRYANRNGDITYNFWQTHPEQYFPNDSRRSRKERNRMADDFDDTSMIFLTSSPPDTTVARLKKKMIEHTNLYSKKIRSTFVRYRKYKAYTTWFGKKMPLDVDICVLANTLLFVYSSGLPLNEYDRESLAFIEKVVENKDHIRHPVLISPYYQKPAIILYHLSRLVDVMGDQSGKLNTMIREDLRMELTRTESPMERMLLVSSLLRLGERVGGSTDYDSVAGEMNHFTFFAASPFAVSPQWLRRIAMTTGLRNFNYACEAYYWTLILENIALSGNASR